jgi:hypothetical protein
MQMRLDVAAFDTLVIMFWAKLAGSFPGWGTLQE